MEEYINRIFNMDCLTGMNRYPNHSIDMILCGLAVWYNRLTVGQRNSVYRMDKSLSHNTETRVIIPGSFSK